MDTNTKDTKPICPRCNGLIPNSVYAGQYPGALSRLDNTTEICSDCGFDEAMEQVAFGTVLNWKAGE